jgi:hypothetical protein
MVFYTSLDVSDSILLKSTDTGFNALYYILLQVDRENNIWHADKINKKHICDKLNLTSSSLEKIIYSLKTRELIISAARGKYKISETLTQDY